MHGRLLVFDGNVEEIATTLTRSSQAAEADRVVAVRTDQGFVINEIYRDLSSTRDDVPNDAAIPSAN